MPPTPPNQKIKIALIGAGALGRQHARIYAQLQAQGHITFTGIHDTNQTAAQNLATQHNTIHAKTLQQLIPHTQAFSIVTPTNTHHQIAKTLLQHNKHLLIEKPITQTTQQAAELLHLSQKHKTILQVGHVERFNPIFTHLQKTAPNPRFIEAHRLTPYPARSTDIGVVLDLMIHDLDIILTLNPHPITNIQSAGTPVLSQTEDIANTRIQFQNHCTANLTASRISPEQTRKIRIFTQTNPPAYISLDYRKQKGHIYQLANQNQPTTPIWKQLLNTIRRNPNQKTINQYAGRRILRQPVPIKKEQPLQLELRSFIQCIRDQQTPIVTAHAAKQALDLALHITHQIQQQNNPNPTPTKPQNQTPNPPKKPNS